MLVSGPTGTRASEDVAHRHRANPRRTHSGPQRFLCLLGSPLPGRLLPGAGHRGGTALPGIPVPVFAETGSEGPPDLPGQPRPWVSPCWSPSPHLPPRPRRTPPAPVKRQASAKAAVHATDGPSHGGGSRTVASSFGGATLRVTRTLLLSWFLRISRTDARTCRGLAA